MPVLPHARQGRRRLVGPNLWGIVGRKVGVAGAGFPLLGGHERHGGEWDWESWPSTCTTRQGAIPGNKMVFAGVKDNADLADLLVYLRKLSDNPPPLPQ